MALRINLGLSAAEFEITTIGIFIDKFLIGRLYLIIYEIK